MIRRWLLPIMSLAWLVVAAAAPRAWSSPASTPDASVRIASRAGLGNYLVDGGGKALYWYAKDSPGRSTCDGPCLDRWPAFASEGVSMSAELRAEDFGSMTRADGGRQTTFRGYPLYHRSREATADDAAPQGVDGGWFVIDDGVWFIIDPARFPPRAHP